MHGPIFVYIAKLPPCSQHQVGVTNIWFQVDRALFLPFVDCFMTISCLGKYFFILHLFISRHSLMVYLAIGQANNIRLICFCFDAFKWVAWFWVSGLFEMNIFNNLKCIAF